MSDQKKTRTELIEELQKLRADKNGNGSSAGDRDEMFRTMITIMDSFPEVLYVTDPETYEVIWVNRAFAEALGSNPAGKLCYQAFHGYEAPCEFCTNEILFKTGKPYSWEYHNPVLDRDFLITDQLVNWPDGRRVRFEHAVDITDRKQSEVELERHRKNLEEMVSERTRELTQAQETLSRQAREILELSTPILMVHAGVLVAPMVGTLDSSRTEQFTERLLAAIVEKQASVAIVDITGVPVVDTHTLQHLLESIEAVKLLGANMILTGIRPAIARTLVHLGVDLRAIETRSSLAAGLRVALDMTEETIEGYRQHDH